MIRTYEISVEERLISWAQNEEMVDQYFTEHGRDCLEAADLIKRLREDAERYRWLKIHATKYYEPPSLLMEFAWDTQDVDGAIDAARKATPE